MDSFFILDIFLSFNVAYRENNLLVKDRLKLFKNYLTGWFVLDLIASFPYQIIQNFVQNSGNLKLLNMLRFIRIFRLFKILSNIDINLVTKFTIKNH